MLLTTTHFMSGYRVERYLGVITSQIVLSTNFVGNFFANIRGTFGGRVVDFEKILREAKDQVAVELIAEAERIGANAIIGISYELSTAGKKDSMMLVNAIGTAVVAAQVPAPPAKSKEVVPA